MTVRKFLRTLPLKLYLLLAAVVVFAFFSNDFGLVDIQKTAVILAAGIDKTERGFSLTAQIAVPKGSDRTTGGTSSVEIEAEGETVSDCVSLIFAKTGWVPKLVFCNLILLGEEAVKEDVVAHLNYFLRNDYMPDSCLLAACEGRAADVISSVSAIDDTSSLAIEKLFSDAAQKSGRVMTCNMKDFAIGYYGVSRSGYLPFVRMRRQPDGQSGEDGNAANTRDSGEIFGAMAEKPSNSAKNPHARGVDTAAADGQPRSGEGQDTEVIYSAEETALFVGGRMVALLSPEETMAFSMLKGQVFAGTFNADDEGKPVTLAVVKNEGRVKLDMKDGPTAELSLSVTLRLCCRGVTEAIDDIASDKVSPAVLDSAKRTLEGYVRSLWETAQANGCDLFHLKRDLYRASPAKYAEWKDALLSAVRPAISAETVSMK